MTPVQQTPQFFTLVLALCVLASLITFLIVVYRLCRGRRASAFALLFRWGISVMAYLAISAIVSATKPARVIDQGQNWCFDDWCIAVEGVDRRSIPNGQEDTVTTAVRIYNGARLPEGVQGFWVYLRDQEDRRYPPTPGPWQDLAVARVLPHEFARTSIDFVVPNGTHELGLVTGHGGGTPCGLLPSLLEIGQGGCVFHRPNMIRVE